MARQPKPWFRDDRNAYFVTVNGVRHNLGADRKAADRRFHELMAAPPPKPEKVPAATPGGLSAAAVFDKFLDWLQTHRSPRTYALSKGHIQSFCDHLGKKASRPAAELRPFDAQEWVDSKPTWGGNHRRGSLASVLRAFSWAARLRYVDANPVAGVEKPPAVRREAFVTPAQFNELLTHFPDADPFRDLLVFLWETGCRPAEARHLEPRHYNAAFARFDLPPAEAKGKKRWRVIRLTAEAKEVVERRLAACTGKVFENEDGRPWTGDAVNCRFQRLKKRANLSHCAYALRHGFATRKLTEGHDHLTVAELMGHANGAMLATVYSHIDRADDYLRKALAAPGAAGG